MQFKITNETHTVRGQFSILMIKGIVISNGDGIFLLDIPVDSCRSKGFYIQGDTLFYGNDWIGTLSNGNEIYLCHNASTLLNLYQPPRPNLYQPPRQETQPVTSGVEIAEPRFVAQSAFSDKRSPKERAAHIANNMFPNISKSALDSAPHLLCLLGSLQGKNSTPYTPQSGQTDDDNLSDISNVSSYKLSRF